MEHKEFHEIDGLPKWIPSQIVPHLFDLESLTNIEMIRRMRTIVNDVCKQSNDFVEYVVEYINAYRIADINDMHHFRKKMDEIVAEYMKTMDKKLLSQDVEITDTIMYIKDHIVEYVQSTVQSMFNEGLLDDAVLNAVNQITTDLQALQESAELLIADYQHLPERYAPKEHEHDYAEADHIHTQYQLKSDVAVVNGRVTVDNSDLIDVTVPLPDGFTSENACIISTEMHNTNNTNGTYGYGSTFDSQSYIRGCLPYTVSISNTDIKLRAKNIQLTPEVSVAPITATYEYRIVLLKIA